MTACMIVQCPKCKRQTAGEVKRLDVTGLYYLTCEYCTCEITISADVVQRHDAIRCGVGVGTPTIPQSGDAVAMQVSDAVRANDTATRKYRYTQDMVDDLRKEYLRAARTYLLERGWGWCEQDTLWFKVQGPWRITCTLDQALLIAATDDSVQQ